MALMAFVKAAKGAGLREQENPYIVIKPTKDPGITLEVALKLKAF